MTFRTHYDENYDSNAYFTELSVDLDSSIAAAQQQFKDECDVNKILEKWLKTGSIEHTERRRATYADFSELPGDYMEACHLVDAAHESFGALPAKLRARFKNDPGEFISWMSSDVDVDEKRSLGLLKPVDSEPIKEENSDGLQTQDESSTQS